MLTKVKVSDDTYDAEHLQDLNDLLDSSVRQSYKFPFGNTMAIVEIDGATWLIDKSHKDYRKLYGK